MNLVDSHPDNTIKIGFMNPTTGPVEDLLTVSGGVLTKLLVI